MARTAASPEQREKVRSQIRKAAADLYAENGLADISVRKVAERAGVSVGTIYSYFESLSVLMQSLWLEPVARLEAELEAVAARHKDPVRRLKILLQTYAHFAVTNSDVYRGALMFVRPGSIEKPERQPLEEFALYRLICEAVKEGQVRGDFKRGQVSKLAQVLWAGLHGALAIPVNMDRAAFERPEVLSRLMINQLMASLRPVS